MKIEVLVGWKCDNHRTKSGGGDAKRKGKEKGAAEKSDQTFCMINEERDLLLAASISETDWG